MTISADGVLKLFPIVQSIVENAPKIEGWNFIAFRQRVKPEKVKDMILKKDNQKFVPNEMKFSPLISGDTIDIIIYVKGVTEENYAEISYSEFILLDNLLGEYDCVKKVRHWDFHEMPTKREDIAELIPLLEIAKYVDEFHSKKK